MPDLCSEYVSALRALRPSMRTRLISLGFGRNGGELQRNYRAIGGFGIAKVAIDGASYAPADDGAPALIFPCWNGPPSGWALIDLAAWSPSSGQITIRCGNAWALNEYAVWPFLAREEPVQVWQSLSRWVADRGRGIVPLDWPRCAEALLESGRTVICETDTLARQCAEAMRTERDRTTPALPQVGYMA